VPRAVAFFFIYISKLLQFLDRIMWLSITLLACEMSAIVQ